MTARGTGASRPFDTGLGYGHEDYRTYMEGWCHLFAVALHREFGVALLVMTDEHPRERFSTGVPPIYHVYADDGNGTLYDVRGAHDRDEVVARWTARGTDPRARPGVRSLRDEGALGRFVGDGDDVPLVAYSEAGIRRAAAAAERLGFRGVLGGLCPAGRAGTSARRHLDDAPAPEHRGLAGTGSASAGCLVSLTISGSPDAINAYLSSPCAGSSRRWDKKSADRWTSIFPSPRHPGFGEAREASREFDGLVFRIVVADRRFGTIGARVFRSGEELGSIDVSHAGITAGPRRRDPGHISRDVAAVSRVEAMVENCVRDELLLMDCAEPRP